MPVLHNYIDKDRKRLIIWLHIILLLELFFFFDFVLLKIVQTFVKKFLFISVPSLRADVCQIRKVKEMADECTQGKVLRNSWFLHFFTRLNFVAIVSFSSLFRSKDYGNFGPSSKMTELYVAVKTKTMHMSFVLFCFFPINSTGTRK